MQISGGVVLIGGVNLAPGSGGSSPNPSVSYGYTSGGFDPAGVGPTTNTIDKFAFASDGNATDVGDLTIARRQLTGTSSTASGYNSGGSSAPSRVNTIDKFPFASDANATDVADLDVSTTRAAGSQY